MVIVVDKDRVRSAAARVGIDDDDTLSGHLGVDLDSAPTPHMIAIILTRLPITLTATCQFEGEPA